MKETSTTLEEKKNAFLNVEKTEKVNRDIKPIVTNSVSTKDEIINGRQVKVRVIEHTNAKPKKNLLSKIFKKQDE